MNTIIVISECLDEREERVNFHFKGQYAGHLIQSLRLRAGEGIKWVKGEEYLLYVAVRGVAEGVLEGTVLRLRRLDELLD